MANNCSQEDSPPFWWFQELEPDEDFGLAALWFEAGRAVKSRCLCIVYACQRTENTLLLL